MDLFALLTTAHGCPLPGTRWLIAIPTLTTNPHAVGRIVTATPRGEFIHTGRKISKFLLTVAVENSDDASTCREFRGHLPLDCYQTQAEAEKWHAIDEEHVTKHGYGRNHWL